MPSEIFAICLFLALASGQLNYPNDPNNPNNPNYNNNNNNNNNSPNYNNPNNPNYYDPNNPNSNNNNNPNNNPYNPNYNNNNNNPNNNSPYNPNYNNPNNPNYNPSSSNYNPNSPNYNPNYNNPSNSNYNPGNPNYNNPNSPGFNSNQNNPIYNSNQNNPNYVGNNQNNFNPSFNSQQPLDQGDCCEEYCYTQDPEPYLYFGTKTAYDSITRRSGNQHSIPDCTPVQFWSILRHGTRLPESNVIRAMRNMNKIHDEVARNYEQRRSYPDRGRMCPQDYDLFRRWRFNESINEGNANTLTRQGIDDMKLLARRYKAKYSDLFQNYDERTYYFQYSTDDRSHDSFQAYVEGLFDQDAYRVHANTVNGNRLTDPFQNCPRWQQNENTQFISKSEVERFKEKSDFQKMTRDVFRKLGFRFTLNSTIIEDMYNLCRYEKAWNPQPRSPWCVAFNKEQLKLLEYVEDLTYYYESGFGNKLAEKLGCSSAKDMYERFERTVNGNPDGNKATLIFAETASYLSTLAALGINKDYTPLTAENYYQQSRRNYRTSTMSPFGANLVATLYQCNRNEKYRVMFFLNEVPVEFQDCSVGLCNWSTVQRKYEDLVKSCNADAICNGRGAAGKNYATLATVVSLFLTLLIRF